jgi:hypothetical protein
VSQPEATVSRDDLYRHQSECHRCTTFSKALACGFDPLFGGDDGYCPDLEALLLAYDRRGKNGSNLPPD